MKNKLLVFLLIFTCFAIGQTTKAVTIRTYTVEEIQQRYAGSIVVEDLNFERRYWYIDALSQERYPLKDGITITRLLKKLGQGISNQDLAKIPENLESTNIDYKLTNQMRGQFVLQVEEDGQAWYINPLDNLRYQIDNGKKGLETLKRLALDISEDKLNVIQVVSDQKFRPLADISIDFNQYWEVWRTLQEDYYQPDKVQAQDLLYSSLKGLAATPNDPYTEFFTPIAKKDFSNRLTGSIEGIGAMVESKNSRVVILSPLEGSPAQAAGLQPQDQIIAVDGRDIIGFNLDDSVSLIKGPAGTDVVLTIHRPATNETFEVTITRAKITLPNIIGEKLDNNIAYFKINLFAQGVNNTFRELRDNIINRYTKGIILDLRNNPGGYTSEAIDIADQWLPEGTMILREACPNETYNFSARLEKEIKLPTIILVNGGTASASEILTSALAENDQATVVGQTTFGKGTGQTIMNFADGTALKYTIFEWLTPDSNSLENIGIEPDYIVENTIYSDEQLKKAKQLLR